MPPATPTASDKTTCCADCKGAGTTVARQRVEDMVRLLLLSGTDVQSDKRHPYFDLDKWPGSTAGKDPGADMIEFTEALAGSKPNVSVGYDSIATWRATNKLVDAVGLSSQWGICPTCKGDG
jgi:hypothetical protein